MSTSTTSFQQSEIAPPTQTPLLAATQPIVIATSTPAPTQTIITSGNAISTMVFDAPTPNNAPDPSTTGYPSQEVLAGVIAFMVMLVFVSILGLIYYLQKRQNKWELEQAALKDFENGIAKGAAERHAQTQFELEDQYKRQRDLDVGEGNMEWHVIRAENSKVIELAPACEECEMPEEESGMDLSDIIITVEGN